MLTLGEVQTLIREAAALQPGSEEYAREFEDRKTRVNEAFLVFRKSASVARIAVAPKVRTVLTSIGDQWNKSPLAEHQWNVARWGWLVMTDIARNDLFGDDREMSDDFVVMQ